MEVDQNKQTPDMQVQLEKKLTSYKITKSANAKSFVKLITRQVLRLLPIKTFKLNVFSF